jgi:hypothetical protein
MRHFKIFILIVIIAGAISTVSCKKYLEDAFPNPNKPVLAEPDTVFPVITSIMARGIMFDSRFLNSYVQYWARTAASDAWDRHGYTAGSDNGGDIWRSHYFGFGQNLINIISYGRSTGRNGYAGAGYAIFAWSWLLLTDYHGEVILKEAFRPEQLTFPYDTQPEVYEHALTLTDSALHYLEIAKSESSSSFSKGDANLYGGDIDKWIKFTYGVKAMIYHRYVLKSDYDPDAVISNIDKSFTSANDDAIVKFPLSTVNEQLNFFGPRRNNLGTMRPTDYLVRLMNGTIFTGAVDPRMGFLLKPARDGVYRGLEPGRGEGVITDTLQRPPNFWGHYTTAAPAGGVDTGARSYYKNQSVFPILTYAQMQFIKAEAAFKKGDKTTAYQAYKEGINGSFDHLQQYYTGYIPFSASDRSNFLANVSIDPGDANSLTLNQIMLQKFVALWPYNPEETWVDLRKYEYSPTVYTGFAFPSSFFADNGSQPAQRARPRYNSEYLWNVESLGKIGALELNYHTKPVWFTE